MALAERGLLDSLTCTLAMSEPLPGAAMPMPSLAPHLTSRLWMTSSEKRVRTTVDPLLQRSVSELVNSHQSSLEGNQIHNAAAIIIEVASGHVLAYAGNSTLSDTTGRHGRDVDMITAPRSTGSIMKPFLYAGLLSSGEMLPNALIADIPTRFQGFRPENSDFTYSGAVPAGDALARSLNIPAVHMLRMLEEERFLSQLRRMGFTTFDKPASHYGLSLILGGGEASLWELAGSYASMARVLNNNLDGTAAADDWHMPVIQSAAFSQQFESPTQAESRTRSVGEEAQSRPRRASGQQSSVSSNLDRKTARPQVEECNDEPSRRRARRSQIPTTKCVGNRKTLSPSQQAGPNLSPAAIWLTYEALRRVNRPETETGWQYFGGAPEVAWKTGTSYGFRDAWAIGTTPAYVVAVWAGNADGEGRPGLSGITSAAPLLFDIIRLLQPPSGSWFSRPEEGMTLVEVCASSGFRAGPDCPDRREEWVPEAGLRSGACPYHITINLDPSEKYRVSIACAPPGGMVSRPWFVLPPAMEYYYRMRNPSYHTLPPFLPGCADDLKVPSMEFIYPPRDARIFIPRNLQGKLMSMLPEIAHRRRNAVIYWHLDNSYIGMTKYSHQTELQVGEGEHIITAVDDEGVTVSRKFYCIGTF